MLKIRLQRTGRRNAPAYRLVVAEHSAPIQGKFVEIVGSYIPTKHNYKLEIKQDRIQYWISKGAQPSQTVARLCIKEGMKDLERFVKARLMKPSRAEVEAAEAKKKAEEEKAAAAEAEANAEPAQETPLEEAKTEETKDEEVKEEKA